MVDFLFHRDRQRLREGGEKCVRVYVYAGAYWCMCTQTLDLWTHGGGQLQIGLGPFALGFA